MITSKNYEFENLEQLEEFLKLLDKHKFDYIITAEVFASKDAHTLLETIAECVRTR